MDADDERLTDWGASRRTYYGGDTADLEIGQKDEDAVAEEALARVQQREALDALDEDDFALDGGDDVDVEEESGDKGQECDEAHEDDGCRHDMTTP